MSLEGDQTLHRHAERLDFFGAAEVRQVDDKGGGDNFRADFLQKLDRPFRRAACGDQIVDEQNLLADS
jgi:hypothetical protein